LDGTNELSPGTELSDLFRSTLRRTLSETERSFDLIIPDQACLLYMHDSGILAELALASNRKKITTSVVCPIDQNTEKSVRLFSPLIKFKPLTVGSRKAN
jgi:hypothetical protein